VFLDNAKIPSVPMTMKIKLGLKLRSYWIRLVEGVYGSSERPYDMKQQQEVTPSKCSLGVMN
jgi:hypothetical protein